MKGVTDPERKRKIIGTEFIRIFEEEAKKLGDIKFLAQGTLYPDVIESQSSFRRAFRGHQKPSQRRRPPREAQHETDRALARPVQGRGPGTRNELGLPEEIVWRHPFPGPGIAVRILGQVTKRNVEIVQKADAIVRHEIKKPAFSRKSGRSSPSCSP